MNESPIFLRTPDTYFYESPRFVTHIDDPAIAALTKFYSEVFPPSNTPGVSMLDMCSSWVSPISGAASSSILFCCLHELCKEGS